MKKRILAITSALLMLALCSGCTANGNVSDTGNGAVNGTNATEETDRMTPSRTESQSSGSSGNGTGMTEPGGMTATERSEDDRDDGREDDRNGDQEGSNASSPSER